MSVALPIAGLISSGCGGGRLARIDQMLMARKVPPSPVDTVAQGYAIRFPDVLDVRVEGMPEACGTRRVDMDGRISLGAGGAVRGEGQTTEAVATAIAEELGVARDRVAVAVAEFNSQKVYLHGEVKGAARAIEYRGPETVLELLQRTGGITPGAAPSDVQVVRAHVALGKSPEVFVVDLEAILLKNDDKTNVRVQPFDQVYVGQTRRCSVKSCIPPWLRPLYERLSGMWRPTRSMRPESAVAGTRVRTPRPVIRLSSAP